MNTKCDVFITGCGPAGLSAAIYAARSGVRVIAAETLVTGGVAAATPLIENYPGYTGISGYELTEKMAEQAKACGAEILFCTAVNIEDGEVKKVTLSGGDTIECYSVVLASGSVPKKLGLPREDELLGAGLSYCATCDGNFFKGKTVAVVGGTRYAEDAAEYLVPLASKVYRISGGALKKSDVTENIGHAAVTELIGSPLRSVKISADGKEKIINVDGLFVELGYTPATGFVKRLVRTDESGYITTDEYMRTSADGIFAAGDARSKPLRQIATAVSDGAIAGSFAAVYAKKAKKITCVKKISKQP